MKRQVDIKEISDGRLYGLNDMVKADCQECRGCSDCCRGMGDSVVLDPLDVHRLLDGLGCSVEELLTDKASLHVVDGLVLPSLRMDVGPQERCVFLDENARCSIHPFRPGICRLFPLGRYYEGQGFRYFLQVHECSRDNRTKVKVHKWIDTPNPREYENFIGEWHNLLKEMEAVLETTKEDGLDKAVSMYLLQHFYMEAYDAEADFYGQFEERLRAARSFLTQLGGQYAET